MLEDEFIGVVFRDDEDGDTCYHVQITVLAEDLEDQLNRRRCFRGLFYTHRVNIPIFFYCRILKPVTRLCHTIGECQHHHSHRRIQYTPRILTFHNPDNNAAP